MEFNEKEKASAVKQQALQALHDENVRLGLYDGVYAIDVLEQENRLLRARNERLEKRTWVGLTDEEIEEVERWVEFKEEGSERIPMGKLVAYISEKLRSKNT
jgi:hypothetical protein